MSVVPMLAMAPPMTMAGHFAVAALGVVQGMLLVRGTSICRLTDWMIALVLVPIVTVVGLWHGDDRGLITCMMAVILGGLAARFIPRRNLPHQVDSTASSARSEITDVT